MNNHVVKVTDALPAARAAALPLNGLQALRGSAALLVVAGHAIATLGEKAGYSIDRSFAWFLGEYGVAIFFISGFINIHSHSRDFGRPYDNSNRSPKCGLS